jgi:hypothetical protein
LDRDEIIVAHMVGGVDAFMEVSQGWPITNSPLKLVSLKNSNHHAKEISLGFLCKVEVSVFAFFLVFLFFLGMKEVSILFLVLQYFFG